MPDSGRGGSRREQCIGSYAVVFVAAEGIAPAVEREDIGRMGHADGRFLEGLAYVGETDALAFDTPRTEKSGEHRHKTVGGYGP